MILLSPSPRLPRTLKRTSKRVNSLFLVTRRSLEISLTFNCKHQQQQRLSQQQLFLDETVFLKYIYYEIHLLNILKKQNAVSLDVERECVCVRFILMIVAGLWNKLVCGDGNRLMSYKCFKRKLLFFITFSLFCLLYQMDHTFASSIAGYLSILCWLTVFTP